MNFQKMRHAGTFVKDTPCASKMTVVWLLRSYNKPRLAFVAEPMTTKELYPAAISQTVVWCSQVAPRLLELQMRSRCRKSLS